MRLREIFETQSDRAIAKRGGATLTAKQINAAIRSVTADGRFYGYGGNCAAFAVVLNKVLGGNGTYILVQGDHYEYADHVALLFKGKMFDASGVVTKRQLEDDGGEIEEFYDPDPNGSAIRRTVDDTGGGIGVRLDEPRLEAALRAALGR